eukprot:2755297-Prorocentrum_lima.AAC.1
MDQLPEVYIVHVTQSPSFCLPATNSLHMPTLLRRSHLVDIGPAAQRVGRAVIIHPLEHYAALGFPVPMMCSPELGR